MLMTLTSTGAPATDLGFLLRKHPDRTHRFALAFGSAVVFWPEAGPDRATCALYVEVDPVYLSRRSHPDDTRVLEPYVNDRPYVASSFLSVAIANVFGSALAGRAAERPELVDAPLPLQVHLPALAVRGGARVVRDLFEPLGYEVTVEEVDPEHGVLGLALRHRVPVNVLLGHLYVLVPVLDDDKHYWVGDDEVEKLLRHGEGWLDDHPHRELIVRRYLKHFSGLARSALARLSADEPPPADREGDDAEQALEQQIDPKVPLNEHRLRFATRWITELGATSVIDLGCGEGRLLKRLIGDKRVARVGGLDVSARALAIAEDRLNLDRLPDAIREKLTLLHGSLLYRDRRLQEGWDLALCLEVIEHLDPGRLPAFEDAVLGFAALPALVITTPNAEYNARFEANPGFRHPDHRFEWTRAEFADWVARVADRYGYEAALHPVGEEDPVLGPPTQAVVLTKRAAARRDDGTRADGTRADGRA